MQLTPGREHSAAEDQKSRQDRMKVAMTIRRTVRLGPLRAWRPGTRQSQSHIPRIPQSVSGEANSTFRARTWVRREKLAYPAGAPRSQEPSATEQEGPRPARYGCHAETRNIQFRSQVPSRVEQRDYVNKDKK